jgi:hypothetical protein
VKVVDQWVSWAITWQVIHDSSPTEIIVGTKELGDIKRRRTTIFGAPL